MALADWFCTRADSLFLAYPPGQYFSYSNLGYILLAAAADTKSTSHGARLRIS